MTIDKNQSGGADTAQKDFLTMTLNGQSFGIPVLQVQDVLNEQKVTRVPLAPPEISGSMNLRGRIVTAINLRRRLGLPPIDAGKKSMSVVVEHHGELYSLIVDSVGDVLSLPDTQFEKTPSTLDRTWREVAMGILNNKKPLRSRRGFLVANGV